MTPPTDSEVTILDPNSTVLRHASERLGHLKLRAVEADVCKPLPLTGPFDSASLNLVIHCLPGPFERKTGAISNVAVVMAPDGVLFGSSVIGTSGSHNVVARTMLRAYNRRGAFDNLDDSKEAISEMLASSFEEVEVETVGSIAVFAATARRSPSSSFQATDPDDWSYDAYVLTDSTSWFKIECYAESRPADGWLSVAESFEFIPPTHQL